VIRLRNAETGADLGTISPAQLDFLVEQLEEEFDADQDYYFDEGTIGMLEDAGADAGLLAMLRAALGEKEASTSCGPRRRAGPDASGVARPRLPAHALRPAVGAPDRLPHEGLLGLHVGLAIGPQQVRVPALLGRVSLGPVGIGP
jgi:hypothetical protein